MEAQPNDFFYMFLALVGALVYTNKILVNSIVRELRDLKNVIIDYCGK